MSVLDLGVEVPSLGERFVEALWEGRRQDLGDYDRRATVVHHGVLPVEQRTALDLTATAPWLGSEDPVAPRVVRRRVMIGDLIPRIGTSSPSVPYIREVTPTGLDLGASAVPEGDAKPEAAFDFEGVTANVGKVAAFAAATTEILEDAVGLRSYVDGRLLYLVAVREEQQIIAGDGTSGSILGITETVGCQVQSFTTSITETVARSLEKVELVDGSPDAIAIHPTAYRAARLAAPDWWDGLDVRVIRTRAVGANKALVGSFGEGATIRDRDTKVAFSLEHDADFVENRATILAERRLALLVQVPGYFVDASLA